MGLPLTGPSNGRSDVIGASLMVQVNNSCDSWLDEMGIAPTLLPIVRSASLGTYPASIVEIQAHFCLFRYADRRAETPVRRALGDRELSF